MMMMPSSKKLKKAARKLLNTCASFHQSSPPSSTTTVVVTSSNSTSLPKLGKLIHINQPDDAPDPTTTKFANPVWLYGQPCVQYVWTLSTTAHALAQARLYLLPNALMLSILIASPPIFLYGNQTDDPILQILDDSIATFRVHRRSILRSARYDDDDPIEPSHGIDHQRLHLSISSEPFSHQTAGYSSSSLSPEPAYTACLSVRLAHQPAIDLVLVACPNGPHLRLIKQCMALVVFSLRPIDRLAVVTYSSAAARVFPLRRMTSYGKRAALQVIDRLFYMGQADPVEGLKKGVKVLGDRAYENPQSCILHLSDNPTRSYHGFDTQVAIQIHRFHVGYSFGTSNGFVMHEFEEFLGRVLGDKIRDIQLRIREDGRIVRLGELRGGEERRIPLNISEHGNVCVEYSYVEDGVRECMRSGEVIVGLREKREISDGGGDGDDGGVGSEDGRSSNAGSWDYHDPYMARRWAKHLHAYRL
ncbi:zinc finger, RING/FYVE/PHD-type containing protein [Tanacetum coccineum]